VSASDSASRTTSLTSAEESSYLRQRPNRLSCALARVEVVRAVCAHGAPATTRARSLRERIALVRLDDALLDAAAALKGATLRSLDTLHLAAAQTLGDELLDVVTYDARMARAADQLGLRVAAPR
jgi:uncharacterized protein